MHPARNGPSAGQGLRRIPVAAQARSPRGEAAEEAAPRRLNRPTLRVGFAGTPAFATRALEAIDRFGFTIPLVLTQPDRPFGRGLAPRGSDVKAYALAHGLPITQPASLGTEDARGPLRDAALDVLVVAAYGLLLPRPVLELPTYGCLNIHASLLPRWRGAAPIARAIDAGDAESGITIMRMDAGLDTGPIVSATAIPIDPRETAGSLHDKLAALGAAAIVDTLVLLTTRGALDATPQAACATYATKIATSDTLVDWSWDALALDRRIRALSPTPGAVAAWRDKPVKLRAGHPVTSAASPSGNDLRPPGTIVAVTREGTDVACGRGVLRLTDVQPAGGRPMSAHAFVQGHRVEVGEQFGNGR